MVILADDLRDNQTLIGFHFNGNKGPNDENVGIVDTLGFLKVTPAYEMPSAIEAHRLLSIPDGN